MNNQVIITTGGLQASHQIIQPIFVQITNRGVLKNQMKSFEKEYEELIQSLQTQGLIHQDPAKKDTMFQSNHSNTTGLHMEKAFYIGMEELKKKAQLLGANAIIHLRYETDILADDADFYFQMYGTAVKMEK